MAKAEVERTATEVAQAKVQELVADVLNNYIGSSSSDAIAMMAIPIIEADNFEDLFSTLGTEPDKELFDVGLHVTGISFNKSDYEEGLPFYATFAGKRLDNGQDFVANCGAWQVVLVAYKMVKNNWLPRDVHFHRSERATAKGYHPVNILPWDEF